MALGCGCWIGFTYLVFRWDLGIGSLLASLSVSREGQRLTGRLYLTTHMWLCIKSSNAVLGPYLQGENETPGQKRQCNRFYGHEWQSVAVSVSLNVQWARSRSVCEYHREHKHLPHVLETHELSQCPDTSWVCGITHAG